VAELDPVTVPVVVDVVVLLRFRVADAENPFRIFSPVVAL
jgi:hypothetical protein